MGLGPGPYWGLAPIKQTANSRGNKSRTADSLTARVAYMGVGGSYPPPLAVQRLNTYSLNYIIETLFSIFATIL